MKNSKRHITPQPTMPPGESGHARASKLMIEWQQRGPETLSGLAFQKLRLVLATAQPVITASAAV